MLQQWFRIVLLCATGGTAYYEQLWDVGLLYVNMVLSYRPWPDRPSPVSRMRGYPVSMPRHSHVFGAYCLFHVSAEQRDGKFRPPAEMGIWVGLDAASAPIGHLVCPIR